MKLKNGAGVLLHFVLNLALFPRVNIYHLISKSHGMLTCSCKHHHLKMELLLVHLIHEF